MNKSEQDKLTNWIYMLCVTNMFVILFLCLGIKAYSQEPSVNSLSELLPYLEQDNVDVKLKPGTYTITAENVSEGTFGKTTFEKGRITLLLFSGSNSSYDFTGVTINVETGVFQALNKKIYELNVTGNHNVIKNLTLVDVGSVHDAPKVGVINVVMDGANNTMDGLYLSTKGSRPYGYGDLFGKSPSNQIIPYKKHSAFLLRGLENHVKNCSIIHRGFGHSLAMQACVKPTIEGCYIEGEVRTTDDILAEKGTGSAADKVDFMTCFGYKLPAGYMVSLVEAGIRAYNTGNTVIDGVPYKRGTSDVTVLNCKVKNCRTGVTIAHATGKRYVEGCTAIGCENGFSLASGTVVDCYADCIYGPVYASTYNSDKNYNADITILPPSAPYYNGSGTVAYIGGSSHQVTLRSKETDIPEGLAIKVAGDKGNIRLLHGNLPD